MPSKSAKLLKEKSFGLFKNKFRKPSIWMISGIIVVAVAVGGAGMYYYTTQHLPGYELTALQNRLSAFMELPAETPTFATVSDISKLRSQPFFSRASNGDKVLIYPSAKKAILYRPATGKVIDVGPIQVNAAQQSDLPAVVPTSGTTSVTPEPQTTLIAIYNGTTITGLAKTAAIAVTKDQISLIVKEKADAAKKDYTRTLVIDVSGTKSSIAHDLADKLKATNASLPAGEKKPDADILIILGTDYPENNK